MKNLTQLLVLISMLGCVLGGGRASGEVSHSKPPTLQVPVTDSRPVIDGKLDEPCWQGAAATGPLKVAGAARGTSTTQAFILRDDGHLYVALRCAGELAETDARTAGEDTGGDPSASAEPPVPLPIRPGCFLSVTKGLPADPVLAALTVECWGRPRKLDAWQSLIGQHTSRNTGGLTPAVRRVTKGFTSPPSFPRPSRPSAG